MDVEYNYHKRYLICYIQCLKFLLSRRTTEATVYSGLSQYHDPIGLNMLAKNNARPLYSCVERIRDSVLPLKILCIIQSCIKTHSENQSTMNLSPNCQPRSQLFLMRNIYLRHFYISNYCIIFCNYTHLLDDTKNNIPLII